MTWNAAAYYHYPKVWVVSRPPESNTFISIDLLHEEVYREKLPVDITVKVLRDGLFTFDFSSWLPGCVPPDNTQPSIDEMAGVIRQRVAVINAHTACLHTALFYKQHSSLGKMRFSPLELIRLDSFDDLKWSMINSPVAAWFSTRYSEIESPDKWKNVLAAPDALQLKNQMNSRTRLLIESDTLKMSFQLLAEILQHPASHALLVTDLYARSCKEYEDHNYELCLVTAWAITEKLLQRLWERYIEDNLKREIDGSEVNFINNDRKKRLNDGRNFSASVISEILSLANYLPLSLYKELLSVRKERNNWLHDLKPISRRTAELSIRLAEEMLHLVDGLNLRVPLESRIDGFAKGQEASISWPQPFSKEL